MEPPLISGGNEQVSFDKLDSDRASMEPPLISGGNKGEHTT